MYKSVYIFVLVFSFICYGQNGPGGVGDIERNSFLKYWIMANKGVELQNDVSKIKDLSGNDIQNKLSGNIQLKKAINNKMAFIFDGNGGHIDTNLSINASLYKELTVIVVYKPSKDSSGAVWGENNGGFDKFMVDNADVSEFNSMVSNGLNSRENTIEGLFTTGKNHITTIAYNEGVSRGSRVYVNGELKHVFTSNFKGDTSNNLQIGSLGANDYNFSGAIAEVIIFSRVHNADRIIAENYLSSKYGIPLAKSLYKGDKQGYVSEVVGVGYSTFDKSLHTKSENKEYFSVKIPEFTKTNGYIFTGHNARQIFPGKQTIVKNRSQKLTKINRDWYLQKIGNIKGATFEFDLSFSGNSGLFTNQDLKLLVGDAKGVTNNIKVFDCVSYDTASKKAVFRIPASINNVCFSLASADLKYDINPLRIVHGENGPGGVGCTQGTSNLEYWFNADAIKYDKAGVVVGIKDLSGNAIKNKINGILEMDTLFSNNNIAIDFKGKHEFITTSLSVNKSDFPDSAIITVYQPDKEFSGAVYGENDGDFDKFLADINIASFDNIVSNGVDSSEHGIKNLFVPNTPTITSVVYHENKREKSYVYVNGKKEHVFTSNFGKEPSHKLQIAALGKNDYTFDGKIAEMIVLSKVNDVQRVIIENYMSAKYAIPLTKPIYKGSSLKNGNYDFEVIGVGSSGTDGSSHMVSEGTGILTISTKAPLRLDSYVFMGHNNKTLKSLEKRTINGKRFVALNRKWFVSSTHNRAVSLSFNLSHSKKVAQQKKEQLFLLVKSKTGVEKSISCSVFQQQSKTAIFNTVKLVDGDVITVASSLEL